MSTTGETDVFGTALPDNEQTLLDEIRRTFHAELIDDHVNEAA